MLNEIKRFVQTVFFWLTDWLACQTFRENEGGLVQVRLDAIGDFILWLDCAREIRALYPKQRITLIANSNWVDLAEKLPYWDEVWSVEVSELSSVRMLVERWRLLRKIRQRGFEVAIHPVFSRKFLHGDSLIRATGASDRIGSTGDLGNIESWQRKISDGWYTRLLPLTEQQTTELERNAEFTRHLGSATYASTAPRLPKVTTLDLALRFDGPYFVIFPGASSLGKRWPVEAFCALVRDLQARTGWRPVLCGSQGEQDLCAAIADKCLPDVSNLAGQTSLSDFVEVVRGARFLVGNDTSAVHIAAAVKTPSVCILGGGHFGRFVPYPKHASDWGPVVVYHQMPCFGCNWRCTQPHAPDRPYPCISSVTVDAVVSAVDCALQAKGNQLRYTQVRRQSSDKRGA